MHRMETWVGLVADASWVWGGVSLRLNSPPGQIPAPSLGGLSIYDNWIRYFNRSSPVYGLVPR